MGRKSKAQLAHQAWLEQLQRWIEEGKPQAILQDLLENRVDLWNKADRLKAIDRAVAVAADKGAGHLMEIGFERMLATYLALQLRLEYALYQRLESWEQSGGDSSAVDETWDGLLAQLDHVYNRQCQIAKAFASVRSWVRGFSQMTSMPRSKNAFATG